MKQSKNTGIAKACPACKKMLIKEVNIEGKGTLKTKCPHCKELVIVEVGKKTTIEIVKALMVTLVILSVFKYLIEVNTVKIISMCME